MKTDISKTIVILTCLCVSFFVFAYGHNKAKNERPILLYRNGLENTDNIKKLFESFDIACEETHILDPSNHSNLYLIFNIAEIPAHTLPTYYIAYNTNEFGHLSITLDCLNKLSQAVAVWDCSWQNIAGYRTYVNNYYYFPDNYEFADPVVLSCLLPLHTLNAYKEILVYSNKNNSDISSHLPTLFVYSVLQNSSIIVEAGVRGGESTLAFGKSLDFSDSLLIGIDIEDAPKGIYSQIENSLFLCMDDLDFSHYYRSTPELKNRSLDMIFIDTTHYYEHTLAEIASFVPDLADNGLLLFHDSYQSPLPNFQWYCLNGNVFGSGWDNLGGVNRAIKDYFSISFDHTKYNNFKFLKNNTMWHLTHYPFSNGLTLIRKIGCAF